MLKQTQYRFAVNFWTLGIKVESLNQIDSVKELLSFVASGVFCFLFYHRNSSFFSSSIFPPLFLFLSFNQTDWPFAFLSELMFYFGQSVSRLLDESDWPVVLFSSGGGPPGQPTMPVRLLLSGQRAEEPACQGRQLPLPVPGRTNILNHKKVRLSISIEKNND